MMADLVDSLQLGRVRELISSRLGLNFPPERHADLQRGLAEAAVEFGFSSPAAFANWLLTTALSPRQLHALATHFTIGETYFFREKKAFDVLSEKVLPDLLHARQGRNRQLRVWSAACCTGEEPYSLAMLLHRTIPDLASWRITVLGTDINSHYLKKAAAGIYGEWSFRDAPPGIRERYFTRTAEGRYEVVPEIKSMVTFASINLADDAWPPPTLDLSGMDIVFCRNVLMYFTPEKFKKAIEHLHRAVAVGGWLVVSPSETSHTLFHRFTSVNFPDVIFYRRDAITATPLTVFDPPLSAGLFASPFALPPFVPAPTLTANPPVELTVPDARDEFAAAPAPPDELDQATTLCQQGRHAEAVDLLLASLEPGAPPEARRFALLARALADQGLLTEALLWCDQWIAADKLDSAAHYFRAIILKETGDAAQARSSLQRAIYLAPNFVLAHFALGNLARLAGKSTEAEKHFANALDLLRGRPPEEILAESDGLTAGRLRELITSMRETKTAS